MTHTASLLAHLKSMGVELELAGPDTWKSIAGELGIVYHHLPIVDGLSLKRDMLVIRLLRRVLKAKPYSLMHLHGAKAALLARIACRGQTAPRVVYTLHGFLLRPGMGVWQRLLYPFGERALSPGTCYIAVSRAVVEDFCQETGVPGDRCEVIYNGVDLERFRPGGADSLRAVLGLQGAVVVGTVGRLVKEKGIETLLEAAPNLRRDVPGVRFLVVGDGPLRQHLEGRARDLGVAEIVTFTGGLTGIESVLRAMDVVVVPSLSEGFSIVVLEAMATGKPVVASRIGGIPEIVQDAVTGFLFPPGDVDHLYGSLLRLCSDERLRRRMGESGCKRAREFEVSGTVRRTLEVYVKLTRDGPAKGGSRR